MNNYEFEKHASGDRVKWILTLIAFIVIAVMLVGIICGWFTKKAPDTTETGSPVQNEEPVTDDEGHELTATVAYAMPRAMVYRSAASLYSESQYSSVTLKATVQPVSIRNQIVDWSVEFVNANSTWARGKTVTDYLTVTPQNDGSTTATVECL